MKRRQRVFGGGLLTLCVLLNGCVGLWHRVAREDLDRIPNDEKIALFDTENEVIMAKDNLEAIDRDISDTRAAIEQARQKQDLVEEGEIAGVTSPDVLELLKEWSKQRVEWREDELRHHYVRFKAAEAELWLARANYELAKAQLVQDHDPERGADVDLEAFEKQVEEWEQKVADRQAEIDESQIMLDEISSTYNNISLRLQEASGGAFGGPWAD